MANIAAIPYFSSIGIQYVLFTKATLIGNISDRYTVSTRKQYNLFNWFISNQYIVINKKI